MHLQRHFARFYGGLVHLELNAAADHHGGKLLLRSVRNAYGVYIFALADDRAVIRSGFYFLQLVGYEYNGFPFARKVMHYFDKFFYLLRGKGGRGLIQYQYICAAVQHLQYFCPLLHAYGYVLNLGVGIHLQAVAGGYFVHLRARRLHVHPPAGEHGFHAEYYVFGYGERLHEHKVLMHHAYAQLYRLIGAGYGNLFAVYEYLAGCGMIQPV